MRYILIRHIQAEGDFPMRVKITEHSVAWIEDEVQAWLARRVEGSTPLCTL
jgi:predicted DNA-binding transcriptional regulator AlpA